MTLNSSFLLMLSIPTLAVGLVLMPYIFVRGFLRVVKAFVG